MNVLGSSSLNSVSKDLGLLVLRVGISIMMVVPHGWGKLVNFSALSSSFPDPLGIGSQLSLVGAVFAEVICSLMLILGIKTRWFSVPLFVTMMVATFLVHGSDPWKIKEKAFLFTLTYLVLMITGGGKFSVRD